MSSERGLASSHRVAGRLLLLLAMASLVGCGDGDLALSPKSAVTFVGQTVAFHASGPSDVTFSVEEGAQGGTVSPAGIYTPPATPGIYHVQVQSKGDSIQTVVARVSVVGSIQAPATIGFGRTATASVADPGGLQYSWSVSGGTIAGASDGSSVQVTSSAENALTLGLRARDADGVVGSGVVTIAAFPIPQIVAPDFLLAGRSGASAAVANPDSRYTYRWTITGGSIAGESTGTGVAFAAGAAGTLGIVCAPVNSGGVEGPAVSLNIPVGARGLQSIAGGTGGVGSTDGSGRDARFFSPMKIAGHAASGGPFFVADQFNCLLRKITPSGPAWDVTTLAGDRNECIDADGRGMRARLSPVSAVAMDSGGNVYLAVQGSIRKMTPDGTFQPFAGDYSYVNGDQDGVGTGATFSFEIRAMAADSQDNIWVVDQNAIRKISAAGVVTTIAGKQTVVGHQDGPGATATFDHPSGIAVDGAGNAFVSQENDSIIRRIDPAGVVSTYAGKSGPPGFADGARLDAGFSYPRGVQLDPSGALLISDCNGIRRIGADEKVVTVFHAPAEPVEGATGACATDVMAGPDGGYLLASGYQNWIGSVSAAGKLERVAGVAARTGIVDGIGMAAEVNAVGSLVVDPGSGLVYFASDGEPGIRTFDPRTGRVSTWASDVGSGSAAGYRALARDAAGNFYLAESSTNVVWKITPDGVSSVLAGSSGQSGFKDGQGAAARFSGPEGVAVDARGNVFVSDAANRAIRKISPDGKVVTLVGANDGQLPADGPPGVARLSWPQAMTVDSSGTLYFCDQATARSVAPDGTVTTIAGDVIGLRGYSDGESGAALVDPGQCGITLDASGNVLLAEFGTGVIRRLTRSGATWSVKTILGTPAPSRVAAGPLQSASLARPRAIGILPDGDLVLGDSGQAGLLVARPCPAGGACTCSVDPECPRGSTCQNGACQVRSWALHLARNASFGIPGTAGFYPGNDFTMEMKIKMDFMAFYTGDIYRKWTDGMEDKHFHWHVNRTPGVATQGLYVGFAGVANPYEFIYFEAPEARSWHHVAISRDGSTERVFIDGHLTGSMAVGEYPIQDANGGLFFGNVPGTGDEHTGAVFSLAEVRLSSGDRYTGDFVPPATMTSDAKTRGLWHLDAGVGTSVPDLSGHGHDGTLSGPLGWVPDDSR